MIFLPSTITGSPRHMPEYTKDALTYVCKYGKPDLFITFTFNPKWNEIHVHLRDNQSPTDRHDIGTSIQLKLLKLIKLLRNQSIFGRTKMLSLYN